MVEYTYSKVNPSGCELIVQFYRDGKRISYDEICVLLNNVSDNPAEGKKSIVDENVKTTDMIKDLVKIKNEAMEIDNEVIYLLADHLESLIHKIRYGGIKIER